MTSPKKAMMKTVGWSRERWMSLYGRYPVSRYETRRGRRKRGCIDRQKLIVSCPEEERRNLTLPMQKPAAENIV